ncbi:hypothetical protein GGI43DRAFT_133542 [Trichoderma evansii]
MWMSPSFGTRVVFLQSLTLCQQPYISLPSHSSESGAHSFHNICLANYILHLSSSYTSKTLSSPPKPPFQLNIGACPFLTTYCRRIYCIASQTIPPLITCTSPVSDNMEHISAMRWRHVMHACSPCFWLSHYSPLSAVSCGPSTYSSSLSSFSMSP